MKKLSASLLFALLAWASAASPAFAAVLRVNNTPGVNVPYTTFAAAQTAAVTGDVIQLEPSNTSYGVLTVTKNVAIMGAGYLLGTGQNTGLQYTPLEASCDAVSFNTGSAGARITGMRILGGITISVSTITVERNILFPQGNSTSGFGVTLAGGAAPGISNIFIRNNFMCSVGGTGVVRNFNIANNIIKGTFTFSLPDTMDGLLTHNVFDYGAPCGNCTTIITVNNSLVTNNIVFVGGPGNLGQSHLGFSSAVSFNNTYTNNLNTSSMFPNNGLTNVNNVNSAVINTVLTQTGTDDAYYRLNAAPSPGRGSGTAGTDLGIFGGVQPYVLGGIPNFPTIYQLNSTVSGTNLNVTLGTKSNN